MTVLLWWYLKYVIMVSVSDKSLYHGSPAVCFCRVFKEAVLVFPVSLNAAVSVFYSAFLLLWRWAVVCLNSDEVWIMELRPLTTIQTNWAAHHWFLILCDVSESRRSFLHRNLSRSTDGETMWIVYGELSKCVNISFRQNSYHLLLGSFAGCLCLTHRIAGRENIPGLITLIDWFETNLNLPWTLHFYLSIIKMFNKW